MNLNQHTTANHPRLLDKKAENSDGGIREQQVECPPETETHGISSFTYQGPQPFEDGVCGANPTGMWYAAIPREHWADLKGQRPDEQPGWHPGLGDRVQQIVLIGQNVDQAALRARTLACLLDERLAYADSNARKELRNPFRKLRVAEEAA